MDGWVFHRTPAPGGINLPVLRERAEMAATEARLNEIIPVIKPDILHAHSPVLNALPAIRAGRRHGIPVNYEVRAFWEDAAASHGSTTEGSLRYRMTRALETRALKRASSVTTICEGLRADIAARGIPEDRITVIANAVDPGEFTADLPRDDALSAELGLNGKKVLGFLGSFYGYEGLHLLIEAMPALLAADPEIRLLMVGGGPEDAALRAQAAALPNPDAVIFTGRVHHSEVQRYYSLVDLLVYPRGVDAADRYRYPAETAGSDGPEQDHGRVGRRRPQGTDPRRGDRKPFPRRQRCRPHSHNPPGTRRPGHLGRAAESGTHFCRDRTHVGQFGRKLPPRLWHRAGARNRLTPQNPPEQIDLAPGRIRPAEFFRMGPRRGAVWR